MNNPPYTRFDNSSTTPTPVTACFPVPGGFLRKAVPRKGEDGHGLLPPDPR